MQIPTDTYNFLSIIAVLISTIIAVYVIIDKRNSDKRAICFELFQLWNSPEMFERRRSVYEYIGADFSGGDDREKGFSRDEMHDKDVNISNNLGVIQHFAADLASLIQEGIVDRRLAKQLFWETALKDWFNHFEAAYCTDKFDNKQSYKDYYMKHVRPLMYIMREVEDRTTAVSKLRYITIKIVMKGTRS